MENVEIIDKVDSQSKNDYETKEHDKKETENITNTSVSKNKRSKTFTGCFTCRSRKIRCDLHKPFCKNCAKSGLICAGYDIKLRWSLPIEFKSKAGGSVSSQVVFQQINKQGIEGEGEFFQRRHVGFVVWDAKKNCKPYDSYEDMDRDLGILHNSGNDSLVSIEGNTKLLGPFGVFNGTRKRKPKELVQKQKKLKTNTYSDSNPISQKELQASDTQSNPVASHDLWLSNELRDDALLTAAALNGDSQFFDFMSTNNILTRSGTGTPSLNNHGGNYNYQNDILNVVFHRGNNNMSHLDNPGLSSNSTPQATSNLSMSNLLNEDDGSNTLIDPTNQHLFYSNYNNYFYNNPYKKNEDLEIHLHASVNNQDDESTDIVEGDNSNRTEMPPSIMTIVQNPLQPKLGFDLSVPKLNNSSVGLPTTALQVQPLTRYLLNYYITEVADLMTVIPLTENPWKTIYFPRALMAIGELLALGRTSTAKNALLNALLAVSAFNLQSKFPKNSDSMKYYLNLGIRLRNQASLFVKKLLGSKKDAQAGVEHCVANEKYKDVLCAVMSMISVDLVWGTMQDTNIYIKWCGRVITTKMMNKKSLSSKARILHRIFLSLKLIQDSTCLNVSSIKEDYDRSIDNEYDVNGDKFLTTRKMSHSSKGRIDFIVDTESNNQRLKNTTLQFVNKKLINTRKYDENFATDALYGLSNSLILLFSQTVQLLRIKIYHQKVFQSLPKDFVSRVTDLDGQLQNWKLDWKLYEGEDISDPSSIELDEEAENNRKFLSKNHEASYHHILSFYHALTIYFNRLIKETPASLLQNRVEKTLYHLNSIQKLIANGEASMIPLFWQGFIAGCEAITLDLQMGFKKWGADIAQYLGSYWGARQIMLEVWRRKRMNEDRDDWVSVIEDWEMNLMLN